MKNSRVEYGDWQTNYNLAKRSCQILKERGVNPTTICEPTCGKGNFIKAALETFDDIKNVIAIDIYQPYIEEIKQLQNKYTKVKFHIFHKSIFDFDFDCITDYNVLFLGNPPWITNSELGSIGSENLPLKSNFKQKGGLESITGKGNFDIAEYILLMIIKKFSSKGGYLAMLVKNSVVKNIVNEQIRNNYHISDLKQYEFSAMKEFGAATNASLFTAHFNLAIEYECLTIDLYTNQVLKKWGIYNNNLVSNIDDYQKYGNIDGRSEFTWRSGLKHDCSKIMEFEIRDNIIVNGFKQKCEIETTFLYPFVKSSDIKTSEVTATRKYVLLTQRNTNDDTTAINGIAPKTYNYLLENSNYLDSRKSIIYKKRPRFCIFGIGDYSFMPYKVIVSGLYKKINFALASSIDNKTILLDDTCYSIGFEDKQNAKITCDVLNSEPVIKFIHSISFSDAKRNINKDLLMRINLESAAIEIGHEMLNISKEMFDNYISFLRSQTR